MISQQEFIGRGISRHIGERMAVGPFASGFKVTGDPADQATFAEVWYCWARGFGRSKDDLIPVEDFINDCAAPEEEMVGGLMPSHLWAILGQHWDMDIGVLACGATFPGVSAEGFEWPSDKEAYPVFTAEERRAVVEIYLESYEELREEAEWDEEEAADVQE